MSSHATPAAPHRHARVLACVLCQHRKIKCDRNFPCANCVKANVTCTPSTPAPARKRRRPNQDLQERLQRCEELLKQYAGAAPQAKEESPVANAVDHVKPEPSDSTPMSTDTQQSWGSAHQLVNEDNGPRYMDSYIWASISEELQAMRDIVETEDPEDASILGSEELTPDNNTDLFFPGDMSHLSIEELTPDPVHSVKLWRLFLERVNPLTKVIHVPTVDPIAGEAATNMPNIPFHAQALMFSIYTMAAFALTDSECVQNFGISREAAMQKWTAGLKIALMKLNFLKNYNMTALQALVLFLQTLQGRYDRHAAWILSGTVVRIAQKMGYHRDGESLGLDPFETEMRRRIWWQLVIQDSKYAMMSGLTQSMSPDTWNTRLPQNVSDSDIYPGLTEPVRPRDGPTEMAFCIIVNELFKFKLEKDNSADGRAFEAALMGHDLDGQSDSTDYHHTIFAKFRASADDLSRRLADLEIQYVDANAGPVHRAALSLRPMMTNKLSEMLVPMREQPEYGTEIFGPKDNLFKVFIMGNEHKMEAMEMLKDTGFSWWVKLHFQFDVLALMSAQLCRRPTGSLADRGWAVMGRVYDYQEELFDMSQKQNSVQAQFVLKAWKMREQAYARAGRAIQAPHFILQLREMMPSHEHRSSTQSSSTPPMASHTHMQQAQQPKPDQAMGFQPAGDMDPFMSGYLDMPALDWSLFGDMGAGGDQLSAAMFGPLGLGNVPMGNMGTVNNMGNPSQF
ncbi:C6 zinc finger domain-containing protein [Purpureocillium lavendulum]|uniref:C6 zinc finger domain-containing protein n=1 Tax=Purpureocillium lavendulum TaxID=1247861 RepID=A0AB34FLM8_9HYPO|nr:C6 zinc finger domain-containing protein [Purpureocillium lavendulum]